MSHSLMIIQERRVYLMKTKLEVFTKFQIFKAEVENLRERRIKKLRYDNGGEYISKEIIAFCKESGIKREVIVPFNPEQNGVAERKNRSIEENVKTILHDQDLPKFMWGESTKTTIYIQNRCSHRSLDKKTSKEVFAGKKPSVDHLRIFGCLVYIHIQKDKRKKLEPSSVKGIFVGYSNSSKAYIISMKDEHHIEVNCDVIFDGSITFKKSKELSIDSDDKEIPIFEEEVDKEGEGSHHEEEGPTEHVQPMVILETRKIPNWLRSTLLDAKGHGAAQGLFRESKRRK